MGMTPESTNAEIIQAKGAAEHARWRRQAAEATRAAIKQALNGCRALVDEAYGHEPQLKRPAEMILTLLSALSIASAECDEAAGDAEAKERVLQQKQAASEGSAS